MTVDEVRRLSFMKVTTTVVAPAAGGRIAGTRR